MAKQEISWCLQISRGVNNPERNDQVIGGLDITLTRRIKLGIKNTIRLLVSRLREERGSVLQDPTGDIGVSVAEETVVDCTRDPLRHAIPCASTFCIVSKLYIVCGKDFGVPISKIFMCG